MQLLVADGRILTLTPTVPAMTPDASIFWATIGGIGLTGIVLRAKIQMKRTESAYFIADTARTSSLQETIDLHLSDGFEDGYRNTPPAGSTPSAPRPSSRTRHVQPRQPRPCRRAAAKYQKDPLSFNNKLLTFPDVFPRVGQQC